MLNKIVDAQLSSIYFDHLPTGKDASYTVIYLGTPPSSTIQGGEDYGYEYRPEFYETQHIDLRRDLRDNKARDTESDEDVDTRGLFEKYQYFTPGKHQPLFPSTQSVIWP